MGQGNTKKPRPANCDSCKPMFNYKRLIGTHNELVANHNNLVDNYNNLAEDSQALLKFLIDLTKGIRMYVTDGMLLKEDYIPEMLDEKEYSSLLVDPGKQFCLYFHNEIVSFVQQLNAGHHAKDVYAAWMETCMQTYNVFKGGK